MKLTKKSVSNTFDRKLDAVFPKIIAEKDSGWKVRVRDSRAGETTTLDQDEKRWEKEYADQQAAVDGSVSSGASDPASSVVDASPIADIVTGATTAGATTAGATTAGATTAGATTAGATTGLLAKISSFLQLYGIKLAALTIGGLATAYFLYKIIKKLKKGKNSSYTEEALSSYQEVKKSDFTSMPENNLKKIAKDPYYSAMFAIALRTRMKPVPEYIYEGLAEDPHNAYLFAKAIKFKDIPEIIETSILNSEYASKMPVNYTIESVQLRANRNFSALFS